MPFDAPEVPRCRDGALQSRRGKEGAGAIFSKLLQRVRMGFRADICRAPAPSLFVPFFFWSTTQPRRCCDPPTLMFSVASSTPPRVRPGSYGTQLVLLK